MVTPKMYEKLARLAVRKGVNVQKDQPLVVRASVRDYAFVRLVVKEAYEAGAKSVSVNWADQEISKMGFTYESEETLAEIPDWIHEQTKSRQEAGSCFLSIISDKPGAMADVDPKKLGAYQRAYYQKMGDLQAYTMNNIGQWCVIGIPSMEWAKVVFPELPEEEAFEKLGDAIFSVTRVGEDNDPVADWDAHDAELIGHAEKLNAYNFKELHFTSELGTDVTVGLVQDHIWVGGGCFTPNGVYFDPNMPTEECFCMPEKTAVNGKVVASKPLSYNRLTNILKSSGTSLGKQTVINYVGYMTDSYLLFVLHNYAAKLVEKETSPKYYFMDTGLLGLMLLDCKSAQLENLVAIELIRRYGVENVYFFENKVEIDFYVPSENLAIQVSMQVLDDIDTKERETRAFAKLNAYIPDTKCILITNSEEATLDYDGIQIEVVSVWKWLLDS